jgi:2-octaprenyl-6-methoxyphenol hydroxylase
VVAADGVASTCCEQLSIEQTVKTLPQSAIITNISTSLPHQHCAFERFTNQGPLALLPMSDNRYSVVWCVKDEYVNSILDMSDEAFTEHLQKAFGWRAGKITKAGSRSHYPLNIYQRPQSVSHRFVAIGNAAQTLHPIAGQGFNLGLRDVAALVEAIGDHQGDIGDYSVLHHYQVKRSCDKSNTIMLTESLVRLFSNDYFATSLGRNVGLALMDNLPFLKAPLLKHTLGLVEVHK